MDQIHSQNLLPARDSESCLQGPAGNAASARVPFSRIFKPPPGTESIDFDIHESEAYLDHKSSLRRREKINTFLFMRWVFVVLIGFSTGLTAVFIDYTISYLFKLRYFVLSKLLDTGISTPVLTLVHLGMCMVLAAVAGALVCYLEPLAAGSGIPEVKCRLNGIDVPAVVHPRTYVGKALGVLFSVAAGLPCGKEGPMIHSGAILGGMLSNVGAALFPCRYDKQAEARDLITAGSAAGVAAAFGAPLGGVLFAMEEGSSHWNARALLRAFVCSSVSALTLNFFLVGVNGSMSWGTLGSLGVLSFGNFLQTDTTTYRIWELPLFMCMGCAGGLLGAFFNGMNTLLTTWRMKHIRAKGHRRFLEVLMVTCSVALALWIIPLLNHACFVPDVEFPAGHPRISCKPQADNINANEAIGLFTAPGEDSIKVLFHETNNINMGFLGGFTAIYFILSCWTYGLGVPSGLFVPSLLTGACWGRLVGQFLLETCHISCIRPGSYALIGAAATLAGMARITISLAVILVEATGNTQWSLPVLFTVVASKWVGDFFNRGIYDIHIGLKHQPLLEYFPERDMHEMRVSEVMTSKVVVAEQLTRSGDLEKLVKANTHNSFPVVVPCTHQLLGMVTRSVLEDVFRQGPMCQPLYGEGGVSQAMRTNIPDGEGRDSVINLGPLTNKAAYTIREEATVRRAYQLFRMLGLRHLPVVNGRGCVVGILTRKDLILSPLSV